MISNGDRAAALRLMTTMEAGNYTADALQAELARLAISISDGRAIHLTDAPISFLTAYLVTVLIANMQVQ